MNAIIPLFALLIWIAPAMASANDMNSEMPSDSRIKLLPYNEGDVYTITSKYGYQSNIVFDKNETIETISVGDRSLWQIIPSGHRLFVRPMVEDVITNMTVITTKRSYQFDLKAASMDNKDAEIIYVAQFVYPDDRKRRDPPPMPVAMPGKPLGPPPHMPPPIPMPSPAEGPNYNYTYSGPDILAPLQVFDNGQTTFIKYHTMPEPLPNTYVVDASGNERPITHYAKDNLIAIDMVTGTLALKSSDGTIMIYNETLNPR